MWYPQIAHLVYLCINLAYKGLSIFSILIIQYSIFTTLLLFLLYKVYLF